MKRLVYLLSLIALLTINTFAQRPGVWVNPELDKNNFLWLGSGEVFSLAVGAQTNLIRIVDTQTGNSFLYDTKTRMFSFYAKSADYQFIGTLTVPFTDNCHMIGTQTFPPERGGFTLAVGLATCQTPVAGKVTLKYKGVTYLVNAPKPEVVEPDPLPQPVPPVVPIPLTNFCAVDTTGRYLLRVDPPSGGYSLVQNKRGKQIVRSTGTGNFKQKDSVTVFTYSGADFVMSVKFDSFSDTAKGVIVSQNLERITFKYSGSNGVACAFPLGLKHHRR